MIRYPYILTKKEIPDGERLEQHLGTIRARRAGEMEYNEWVLYFNYYEEDPLMMAAFRIIEDEHAGVV